MNKFTLSSILLVLFFTFQLIAQQQKGDSELGINGYYFASTSGGSGVGNLSFKYGYFFTDNFEAGIGPNFTFSSSKTTVGSAAFFQYSFLSGDGTNVPYFGAQYFKNDFDSDDSGAAGATLGIKFYLKRNAAFDIGFSYLFPLDNAENGLIFIAAGLFFIL